jgi:glycine/D-amino acid oxidase-like deaminating enzyme
MTDGAEVVVVGGGTRLAAAIEARRLGRSVVLIEKNPKLGRSTTWSIGFDHGDRDAASATPGDRGPHRPERCLRLPPRLPLCTLTGARRDGS